MRIARLIFAGSIAALVVMAAPALARNAVASKTDDKATSSNCHAYEQAADGSWTERPCEEQGAQTQTQHKPAAKGAEEAPHS